MTQTAFIWPKTTAETAADQVLLEAARSLPALLTLEAAAVRLRRLTRALKHAQKLAGRGRNGCRHAAAWQAHAP